MPLLFQLQLFLLALPLSNVKRRVFCLFADEFSLQANTLGLY